MLPDAIEHAPELLELLFALTGDLRFRRAIAEARLMQEKGETITLTSFLERAERKGEERGLERGRSEGLERGLEQGLERGRSQGFLVAIRNLMETMKWSAAEAMAAMKIPQAEQARYAAML